MLNRRADVSRSTYLDRENVWRIFQNEIGVESDSMAEIAALPEIIRVHFQSEFVTNRYVEDVTRSLRHSSLERIEAVMIPTLAIDDVQKERNNLKSYLALAAIVGSLLVVCIALVTGISIRVRGQEIIASRIGRAALWMRLGPFLGMSLGTITGMLLMYLGVLLVVPQLFWNRSTPNPMVAIAVVSAPALLVILVHAVMAIAPSIRQRGWQ